MTPTDKDDRREEGYLESGRFALSGLRVLLAEDNVLTKSVLVRLLERQGMAVDAVSDGREAVTLYRQGNYSMILMDCQMPEMDGYEATRKIRELEKGVGIRTPVVAITARTMAGERRRCHAAGMDDYLVKPVEPEALFECITANLLRKRDKI